MFYDRLLVACDLRKKAHTTLLRKLGCSPGMTSGWKMGSFPRSDIVVKLADELSVSTDYLLERVDFPDMYSTESRSLDDRERELIDGIRAEQEPAKNLVFKMAFAALSLDSSSQRTAFSSPDGQESAHNDRAIRPYPKQRQATGKRRMPDAWKAVEGKVAAGPPIETVAAEDQRIMVPVKYTGEQYFIVQAAGDSMLGLVNNGDFCVLDKYGHYDDGRVVFVQVDGPTDQLEAALKRIYRRPGDKVELRSENPKCLPMIYPADEVRVMGGLVAVLRRDLLEPSEP